MKRILIVLLAFLMVLSCFVSCGTASSDIDTLDGQLTTKVTEQSEKDTESKTREEETTEDSVVTTETDDGTDSETQPIESEAPTFNLIDNGSSKYKIIFPNKASSDVKDMGKDLSAAIKATTGVSITNMADSLMGATGPVILLGDTKYPESVAAKAELTGDYSFIIKVFEGNRIAICATEDGVLQEAVNYFVDNYVKAENGTISISTELLYKGALEFDDIENSLLLTINGATKYGIVYSADADLKTKKLVEKFGYNLNSSTGADFDVYQDKTKSADSAPYEIVIGKTNRANLASISANSSQWKTVVDNGKIYINASSINLLSDGLVSFVSQILQEKDNFSYVSKTLFRTGGSANYDRKNWDIYVPSYDGGTLAANTYNSSTGRYNANTNNESTMELVNGTSNTEFDNYVKKLESNGYKQVSKTTVDNNIHVQYRKGYSLVYAYYNNYYKEVRVIDDCASVAENEFEYTYTPKDTDTVAIIQYALMCVPSAKGNEPWPGNGMFYVIKLADNSVVLIDGGNGVQATNAAADALYTYLRKITGVPETEKIRIAALYYSHPHGDHVNMSPKLIERHGKELEVERLMCNFPSKDVTYTDDGPSATIISFIGSLKSKYPNIKMVQLHTGQQIELGGAKFNVLYTQEDSVSASTGRPLYTTVNNYCTVLSVDYKGARTMFLGDIANPNGSEGTEIINRMKNTYSNTTFKSKIVQVSHHGLNRMDDIYKKIAAEYALFSTTDIKDPKTAWGSGNRRTVVYDSLVNTCGMSKDKIFFMSRKNWHLSINNSGKITVTYTDIEGVDSNYWTETNKFSAYKYSVTYKKTF